MGQAAKGPTFTAAGAFTSPYQLAVQAGTPWFYYRLADAGATTTPDAKGSGTLQPDTYASATSSTNYYEVSGITNATALLVAMAVTTAAWRRYRWRRRTRADGPPPAQ